MEEKEEGAEGVGAEKEGGMLRVNSGQVPGSGLGQMNLGAVKVQQGFSGCFDSSLQQVLHRDLCHLLTYSIAPEWMQDQSGKRRGDLEKKNMFSKNTFSKERGERGKEKNKSVKWYIEIEDCLLQDLKFALLSFERKVELGYVLFSVIIQGHDVKILHDFLCAR